MTNWSQNERAKPLVWEVSGLVQAISDAVQARLNPVSIKGEISGWTQASSGHCYFTLKDAQAQLRCAMFRRAAGLLSFRPKNGDHVELRGRLDIYPARGELQVIVETMRVEGEGALMEQFLVLRDRLQRAGLFDPSRKKPVLERPQHIGVITSLQAAALKDVATTLQRRVPHVPVTVFPASVQGERAVPELLDALDTAQDRWQRLGECQVLLLVRGGGAMEDLWAFNDERLAERLSRMPMPVICGVGHETDFTIADFVCDLRAATPTAAAELASNSLEEESQALRSLATELARGAQRWQERQSQRLDRAHVSIGRPSAYIGQQRQRIQQVQALLLRGLRAQWQVHHNRGTMVRNALQSAQAKGASSQRKQIDDAQANWVRSLARQMSAQQQRLARMAVRLESMSPQLVLERGYALLQNEQGQVVSSVGGLQSQDNITATLADGRVGLTVR